MSSDPQGSAACSCSHERMDHSSRGCRRCGCEEFTPATTCPYCRANPAWANGRYFDMLKDRDRERKRYIKCRDQLTTSRWLIVAVSVAAVVGWLR